MDRKMIKIMVADDHAIVRKGIKQCVGDTEDIVVADEASNGDEVLIKALDNDYDVILLDITMPGRNGLDVLKELKNRKPELNVLILTMHPEEQYAKRVLKAGASGYLTKESAPQELILAIRRVAGGGRYISSTMAEKLAFELWDSHGKHLYQTLSDREYQIMCMIAEGKRLNTIAEELCLSIKTISTYRSRLLNKLNLKTNTELALYAVENNLINR